MENRVVIFNSRNKDNKQIPGFTERHESFISTKDDEILRKKFNHFVSEGLPGELCRMYMSINEIDIPKVNNAFAIFLLQNPGFNPAAAPQKLASFASLKENKKTRRWLFDCDDMDEVQTQEFIADMRKIVGLDCLIEAHETPHGYAVVSEHGMDTRSLMDKWGKTVDLKRDATLCVYWKTNS